MCAGRDGDRQHSIPRTRRLLLVACLLLGIGGGWWLWYLRNYHPVLDVALTEPILEPRASGFMLTDPYAFYGWDGKQRWQVSTHQQRYARVGSVLMEVEHLYALSDDGHFLSVINSAPWEAQATLETWKDGQRVRKMALPIGMVANLQQMDDGAAYVSGKRQDGKSRALLVRGHRIAASATDWLLRDLSPDGSMALASSMRDPASLRGGILCRLSVSGNQLRITSVTWRSDCSLHDKGIVLFSDGAVLKGRGVVPLISKAITGACVVGLSPVREFAAIRDDRFRPARICIISPVTRKQWSLQMASGYTYAQRTREPVNMTDDGQFAAVLSERDSTAHLRRLFAAFPNVVRRIPYRREYQLHLYQRPGRLIDRIANLPGHTWFTSDSRWFPSPDGRAVVGLVVEPKIEQRSASYRCLLLRKPGR